MSVWHTGNNLRQIYQPNPQHSFQMAPSNTEEIGHPSFNPHLESLIAKYNQTHAENTMLFVKALLDCTNGATIQQLTDFKSILQVSVPQAPAQNYRDHKAMRDGNNETSGWNDNNAPANNADDAWGDSNKSSDNNNNRNPRRDFNQSGRGDGNPRPPREPKPGDWKCSKCNANNFQGRTSCFRRDCGEPKGDADSSSGGNFGSKRSSWGDQSNADNGSKRAKVEEDWDSEPARTSVPSAPEKKVSPKDDDDW